MTTATDPIAPQGWDAIEADDVPANPYGWDAIEADDALPIRPGDNRDASEVLTTV